ncbi:MAG: ATP-binding protein [Comamonas sp.]
MNPPADPTRSSPAAVQRVIQIRRDYNNWVAQETLEDYALRFTPRSFRKWSSFRVANTAFGAASFLVLEAVGATLLVQFGFVNAFWAILATGLVIFLAGLPISYYAARHGLDMDLLTRGAGFGYIGSTLTSLIYATFTFIFFALEAAIMAYALELALGIPPALGYLLCALVVIPLVTFGVTTISRLQALTQPLWLVLLVLPFFYVLHHNPGLVAEWAGYAGADGGSGGFDLLKFGAALTVGVALVTQMGEQADYLRFMPERRPGQGWRWWAGVIAGGPGWVVLGVLKMLGGALLAYLAIRHAVPAEHAVDPNQMYLAAYAYVFASPQWAVAATAVFVFVSQLKINVTNAYAGSLAWSNFFARLTHSHPGRVVWMIFNILIALSLMELDVFQSLGAVLGLYGNIAIAWMMAVVADLVINKPLGLSPPGIEFKRAHLYDINPVGVGAMGLASLVSIAAYLGWLGETAQAFSAVLAMATALLASPALALATRGRYYLVRRTLTTLTAQVPALPGGVAAEADAAAHRFLRRQQGRRAALGDEAHAGANVEKGVAVRQCTVCQRHYEPEDMSYCPAYVGNICSLCCSLDARCHDQCKPEATLAVQWRAVSQAVLPRACWPYLETGLGHFLLLMAAVVLLLAALLGLIYRHEAQLLGPLAEPRVAAALRLGYLKVYAALLLVAGVVAWWLVLTHKSRQVAQEESNRQTQLLVQEIESHRLTDEALQQARRVAEQARHHAEQANEAKTRYVSAISHELRTPLNSILGYAQLLDGDEAIPPHRRAAVATIRRSGDHLLSLIEGTLDVARIEGGKLTLDIRPMRFRQGMREIADMFALQASSKGLAFRLDMPASLPEWVRADEKRVRQILINILGNAVKFTHAGHVALRLRHAREMATVEIEDSGPGMSEAELASVFEPFARGAAAGGGSGLGLTISKMLTGLMGGELTASSTPGQGTLFRIRLFLPELAVPRGQPQPLARERAARTGYAGARRIVWCVDNERDDRQLLASALEPLGFAVRQFASGDEALRALRILQGSAELPHALFMDLAMPGLDGWATIAAIQRERLSEAPIAVVSANAFEKGADNAVGITAEDFLLKPVRIENIFDWLGSRLRLEWQHAPAGAAAPGAPGLAAVPPEPLALMVASQPQPWPSEAREWHAALAEAARAGYPRGVQRVLDDMQARWPERLAWIERARALARAFAFDAVLDMVEREPADPGDPGAAAPVQEISRP